MRTLHVYGGHGYKRYSNDEYTVKSTCESMFVSYSFCAIPIDHLDHTGVPMSFLSFLLCIAVSSFTSHARQASYSPPIRLKS